MALPGCAAEGADEDLCTRDGGIMETGPVKICETAGKSLEKKIDEFPLISYLPYLIDD